jgi:DNA-3-methyladenine glycosylase
MGKIETIKFAGLKPLRHNFFNGDVEEVAKSLIGTFLFTTDHGDTSTGGMIVETEAYDEPDPAAHCHEAADKRRLNSSGSMRLKGGHAYVYSYRINIPSDPKKQMWCLNFSSGVTGVGSAVLLRALRPICGIETMRRRRIEGAQAAGAQAKDLTRSNYLKHVCRGPAKLCEALGVTFCLDGRCLNEPPFELRARDFEPKILCGPRVGVTKAEKVCRRYALKGSEFISERGQEYPLSEIVG